MPDYCVQERRFADDVQKRLRLIGDRHRREVFGGGRAADRDVEMFSNPRPHTDHRGRGEPWRHGDTCRAQRADQLAQRGVLAAHALNVAGCQVTKANDVATRHAAAIRVAQALVPSAVAAP